jgi:hypothetical protein
MAVRYGLLDEVRVMLEIRRIWPASQQEVNQLLFCHPPGL